MTFLERYQNGDYRLVWAELVALGEVVREAPLFDDAMAVARETMRRVRHNATLVRQRLITLDYRFVRPNQVLSAPEPMQLAHLEALIGPLPLSLRAWFEIVGGVDFRGSHPTLCSCYRDDRLLPEFRPHDDGDEHAALFPYYADPLYFWDVDEALDLVADEDARSAISTWFCVPVWFGKAGVSGGVYYLDLPSTGMDVRLQGEPHETTFVGYLRTAFEWSGFPGHHLHTADSFAGWRRKWQLETPDPRWSIPHEQLRHLSEGLLPL